MARHSQDKELEQYRKLMEPPKEFADGFTWKTVLGAIFLGFLILPGAMYLSLVVGPEANMQEAARWVTIILFAEIARRSFQELKMQEIYIFYFMAGLIMMEPFQSLLWRQYFVRSDYAIAMGVAQEVPTWWSPSAATIMEQGRTFFRASWIMPIVLVGVGLVVSQMDQYGLGYVLYRITNDIEELPFPMAPVAASGITALVQSKHTKETWRWRCFSIGGVIGLMFGLVYVGIPAITGTILAKPLQLIPIPWVDLTPSLSRFIPATGINISFNLMWFFTGMVIPFWAVVGGTLAVVLTMILNPFLYRHGILSNWNPQMGVIDTLFTNNVDFYLSFSLGLTLAITVISLSRVFNPLFTALRARRRGAQSGEMGRRALEARKPSVLRRLMTNNTQRGDFSIFIAIGIYLFTNAFWISMSTFLIEGFPWKFFVFYTLILTPLLSYATAKLTGLCGQSLQIPYIKEATYILSGYRGVKIWFAPVPVTNYGHTTVNFRVLELTGTKVVSQMKTMAVSIPIIVVCSIIFAELLWRMADIPSAQYPYAQRMWDLMVKNMCLQYSSTMEGGSLFMEALRLKYVLWGLSGGVCTFAILSLVGLPTLLVFGLVRGLGHGTPSFLLLELLGALVGRFYFRRKFGDMWMKYTPVLLAGFACGMGLVGMVAVSFTILNKMMAPLVY